MLRHPFHEAVDKAGSGECRVDRLRHEHELRCEFRNSQRVVVHDSRLATNLYYIAQEALRNAAQHGHARRAVVELTLEGRDLVLRIGDDGCGFDSEASARKSGSGLRIMAYRSRLIGGELVVTSGDGDGTTVTCIVARGRSRDGWEAGC
jgi:signal transduction histidine kinase